MPNPRSLAGLLVLGAGVLMAQGRVQAAGPPVAKQNQPLQFKLTHKGDGLLFEIELHNRGPQDLVLETGMMLDGGKKQLPHRIALFLIDPQGEEIPLSLKKMPTTFEGRIDPMVVPLPVGATLTLPISLNDYYAPKKQIRNVAELTTGVYGLRATFVGYIYSGVTSNLRMRDESFLKYWTGMLASGPVRFTLTGESGGAKRP